MKKTKQRKNNLFSGLHLGITIGFVLISAWSYAGDKQNQTTPNIILILADDLGIGDLSCNGATKISTPAIDKIASEGIIFKKAYASSSLCSPSRYTLMTGRYSWRTSLKSGVLAYYDAPLIEPERTTLASMLKRNGYYTVCIGKWHLGFNWVLKDSETRKGKKDFVDFSKIGKDGPTKRGFDYFYGINGANNMLPHAYIENDHVVGEFTEKEKAYDHYSWGVRTPDWEIAHVNEVLTRKAVKAIDDHFIDHNAKPLFLYFATSAIHDPCLPSLTKGESRAGMRGDLVQELDWTVDEIVKALKRNNAYDNTILIFTSDNGPRPGDPVYWINKYKNSKGYVDYTEDYYKDYKTELTDINGGEVANAGWLTYGHKSAGSYLGFKGDAWDGGFRVPLIIRWRKIKKNGTINQNIICLGDIMATIAELIGDKLNPGEAEDSYSFLQNIIGESSDQIRKSMVISSGGTGAFVVFKEEWKYIEGVNGGSSTFYPNGPCPQEFQLYNLKKDPFENHNLYKTNYWKAEELKAEIEKVEKHTISEAQITKF